MRRNSTDLVFAALMSLMGCLLLFSIFGLTMSIKQGREVREKCAEAGGERMRGKGNSSYCIVDGKVVDILRSRQ
jgi:hypothetical protein